MCVLWLPDPYQTDIIERAYLFPNHCVMSIPSDWLQALPLPTAILKKI